MVLSVHTDWWANLFSGFIGAVVGGVISLGIALLVLSRTRAADRDREQEARAHAAARILTEATSTFSWECMEAWERDQRSGSGQAQREAAEKAYIAAIMLDQPALPERPTGKVLAMTMDVVADYSDTYDAIVNQALRRGGMTGYGPQRDQEWLGDRLKEVLTRLTGWLTFVTQCLSMYRAHNVFLQPKIPPTFRDLLEDDWAPSHDRPRA